MLLMCHLSGEDRVMPASTTDIRKRLRLMVLMEMMRKFFSFSLLLFFQLFSLCDNVYENIKISLSSVFLIVDLYIFCSL